MGSINESLDHALRKIEKNLLRNYLLRWQARLNQRCYYLKTMGKKEEAEMEKNISYALLKGLNPHVNDLNPGGINGANK